MIALSLRIIAGPAGSGKTSYITRSIVEYLSGRSEAGEAGTSDAGSARRPAAILLVPDQATFQMERRILEDPRIEGFMDLHILSFRRLALRVLEETGGLSHPFITSVGRSMAVQSVLWRCRKDLTVFAPMVDYPGFREALVRTLSEFMAYDIDPGSIRDLGAGEEAPFLGQKLHDLSLVYEGYREFLKGRFLDPEDYLALAAERMGTSSLVRGAVVWIDGFSGFTPREYRVLKALLATSSQVNLALCIDEAEIARRTDEASLFHPTRETLDKVLKMAWEAGVEVEPTLYLEKAADVLPRFEGAPELAALERRIRLGTPAEGVESAGWQTSVRLVSAANPLSEIEFVAREIVRLVRDQGLRFRDITVEARDLSMYKTMLPLVFRDYGIPFFLDMKRPISHHPLAELVRAALDVGLTSWSSESVFRYLKTDLVPVGRDEVDELENYVLAHGITGERWISEEPWAYARKYTAPGEGLDDVLLAASRAEARKREAAMRAEAIRREATRALASFYHKLKKGPELTAEEVSGAVLDLLSDLEIPDRLDEWRRRAEERGDLVEAGDHAAVWDKVVEVLEQAGQILKDQPRDMRTYALLLNAGLEDLRLGAIPPALDQVLVGTVDRTRQPDCQVTFLIGALMGVFPKKLEEDSVFTDTERESLLKRGIELEPSSSVRQLHEKYLVYIALTRPRRLLYVTYSLGDEEGKALTPSFVVDMIRRALPHIEEELATGDPPGTEAADLDYVHPGSVTGVAARRLSVLRKGMHPGDIWLEAYRWLLEGPLSEPSRRVLSSLNFTNKVDPLERDLTRSLYGRPLFTSVSRLETFGACPFRHFAEDGLGLKEREVFRLEPAGAGVFLHEALRRFVERGRRSGVSWDALSVDDAKRTIDEVVGELLGEASGEIFASSARYKYVAAALRRVLRAAGSALLAHIQRGAFRPVAEEILFGFPGGLKPLKIPLSGKDEILLRGQIDRVDAVKRPDGTYVRVIDYKSGRRSLDLIDVVNGLSLQLLVYLAAVLESWGEISSRLDGWISADPGQVFPAGAFYLTIADPVVRLSAPPEDLERLAGQEFRMTGLLLGDTSIARLLDSSSERRSDIIPAEFLKDGQLGARSSSVAPNDLHLLLKFVREKIRQMAGEVLSGRMDIAPYRKGSQRACRYCPYGPLCCFDVLIEGDRYRIIRSLGKESLWKEIRALAQGGSQDV